MFVFFFSSRRRHTRWPRDWSSDVCSSDLPFEKVGGAAWSPIEASSVEPGHAGPLSFSQERLWVLDRMDPGNPAYNISVAMRLSGRLDAGALAGSLTEIVRRHAVLRSVFAETGDGPVQIVGSAELVRFEAEEHVAFFAMHHIASDGWSMGVLIGEISALYAAFCEGRPSPLPALPVQYLDYARWQRGWLTAEVLEAELAYWREALAGIPVLQLPTVRPRPPFQTFRGSTRSFTVPSTTATALKALGQRQGGTLFMALLAAF